VRWPLFRWTLQPQFDGGRVCFKLSKVNGLGMTGPRGPRLTVLGQNIFFTTGRVQATQEFYNGLSYFLIPLHSCYSYYSIVTPQTHSSDVARNEVYNVQHFTNNTNLEVFQRSFHVKVDSIQPESTIPDWSCFKCDQETTNKSKYQTGRNSYSITMSVSVFTSFVIFCEKKN